MGLSEHPYAYPQRTSEFDVILRGIFWAFVFLDSAETSYCRLEAVVSSNIISFLKMPKSFPPLPGQSTCQYDYVKCISCLKLI